MGCVTLTNFRMKSVEETEEEPSDSITEGMMKRCKREGECHYLRFVEDMPQSAIK